MPGFAVYAKEARASCSLFEFVPTLIPLKKQYFGFVFPTVFCCVVITGSLSDAAFEALVWRTTI